MKRFLLFPILLSILFLISSCENEVAGPIISKDKNVSFSKMELTVNNMNCVIANYLWDYSDVYNVIYKRDSSNGDLNLEYSCKIQTNCITNNSENCFEYWAKDSLTQTVHSIKIIFNKEKNQIETLEYSFYNKKDSVGTGNFSYTFYKMFSYKRNQIKPVFYNDAMLVFDLNEPYIPYSNYDLTYMEECEKVYAAEHRRYSITSQKIYYGKRTNDNSLKFTLVLYK